MEPRGRGRGGPAVPTAPPRSTAGQALARMPTSHPAPPACPPVRHGLPAHQGEHHMSDLKLAVILGSTRPGRNGKAVADWVVDRAGARIGAHYELVDLVDYPPPEQHDAAATVLVDQLESSA